MTANVPARLEALRQSPVIAGLIHFGPRPFGMGGEQAVFKFENGYGASVVLGPGTYGVELAAIRWERDPTPEDLERGGPWHMDFVGGLLSDSDPEFDDGVRGYLDEEALLQYLTEIMNAQIAQKELDQ